MKTFIKRTGIVAFFLLLAGCTRTYTVAGIFEGSGDTFSGTVVSGLAEVGDIDIIISESGVRCTGNTRVSKRPSGLSGVGARGTGSAICSDETSFRISWLHTSETGGNGRGIDSNGGIVKLFFDEKGSVAELKFEEEMLNQLEKDQKNNE